MSGNSDLSGGGIGGDNLLASVKAMLLDAVNVAIGTSREQAARYVEELAPAAASAASDILTNPTDDQAAFVLDGVKVQAIQLAAEQGIALTGAAENGLKVALDVGIRVLSRIIRGA